MNRVYLQEHMYTVSACIGRLASDGPRAFRPALRKGWMEGEELFGPAAQRRVQIDDDVLMMENGMVGELSLFGVEFACGRMDAWMHGGKGGRGYS